MNKIMINPPPIDRKCHRCGKHVNDLNPFGKEGDPLVGNFNGAKLVNSFSLRTWRIISMIWSK